MGKKDSFTFSFKKVVRIFLPTAIFPHPLAVAELISF
jgi:hypothetical protein